MLKKLHIVDTTLRDGEQAPGVAFTVREKVIIARMLDFLGVDVIEAGTPAMGGVERASVSRIGGLGLKARVTTWNRIVPADIRASLDCGVSDVHISAPVSDIQIKYKLGRTRRWVIDNTARTIRYARECGCRVSVGAEDSSRADRGFLVEFALLAQEMGADRFRYADTVGVLDPFKVSEGLSLLGEKLSIDLEFHGHNDFGMATANAVAALKAGAKYIDTTIMGLGERAGNTDLKSFVRAAKIICGVSPGLRINMINRLERFVASASNRSA